MLFATYLLDALVRPDSLSVAVPKTSFIATYGLVITSVLFAAANIGFYLWSHHRGKKVDNHVGVASSVLAIITALWSSFVKSESDGYKEIIDRMQTQLNTCYGETFKRIDQASNAEKRAARALHFGDSLAAVTKRPSPPIVNPVIPSHKVPSQTTSTPPIASGSVPAPSSTLSSTSTKPSASLEAEPTPNHIPDEKSPAVTTIPPTPSPETGPAPTNERPYDMRQGSVSGFNNSGVYVNQGQRIKIKASGQISFGLLFGAAGPDGIGGLMSGLGYNIIPNCNHGVLLWRIGEDQRSWSCCGSECEFVADRSGYLVFNVNDREQGNNSGAYEVKIGFFK